MRVPQYGILEWLLLLAIPPYLLGFALFVGEIAELYEYWRQLGWNAYSVAADPPFPFNVDADDNVWLSDNGTLKTFNGERWESYSQEPLEPAAGRIFAMESDTNGSVWIATDAGLVAFDGSAWTVHATEVFGEYPYYPRSIAISPEGRPWVAAFDQLFEFDGEGWVSHSPEPRRVGTLRLEEIEFDDQGRLWIASEGHGLYVFDGKTWRSYSAEGSGLPSDYLSGVLVDQANRVWVGTHNWEIGVLRRGEWSTFSPPDRMNSFGQVSSVSIDPRGRVWTVGQGGAVQFDGGRWREFRPTNSGLDDDYIIAIEFDSKGQAWLLSSQSLYGPLSNDHAPIPWAMELPAVFVYFEQLRWFPFVLPLLLWLGVLLKAWPGMVFGMGVGLLAMVALGPPVTSQGTVGLYILVTGSMIGGVGSMIDRTGGRAQQRLGCWGIGLALGGALIAFALGLAWLFVSSF